MGRKTKTFTCETCGRDAGEAGVMCNTCEAALFRALLNTPEWCENAITRSGDLPNETMLDTVRRELRALEAIHV